MKSLAYAISLFMFFLISCNNKINEKDDNDGFQDCDAEIDIDLDSENDSENDNNEMCNSDSDCKKNEVCDPYGDCLCDVSKGFFIKYKNECIDYVKFNNIFCSGHGWSYEVMPEFLMGYTGIINDGEEDNVICNTCLWGYAGDNCEKKMDLGGYSDSFMEWSEASGSWDLIKPAPYCENDLNCVDGLKCENGYCICPGNVEFKDNFVAELISMNFGMNESKNSFSGQDLAKLNSFQLLLDGEPHDLANIRCLSNVRKIVVIGNNGRTDMNELGYLKKVQHLAVIVEEQDTINWISEMDNLLSLDVTLYCDSSLEFLEKSKSADSIVNLELRVFGWNGCFLPVGHFSPLNKIKNLTMLHLRVDEAIKNPVEINLKMLSEMKNLRSLYIENFNEKIVNVSVLNELPEIRSITLLSNGGYNLKDLKRNEKLVSLAVTDSVVTEKIAEVFPNITNLYYGDITGKGSITVLSGLNNLVTLMISGDLVESNYHGQENSLKDMIHLKGLEIAPLIGGNLKFLERMKYLESLQLLGFFPDSSERDISVLKDKKYFLHFYDSTGGTRAVDSFVENCKNGGTLCRNDVGKYIRYYEDNRKNINIISPKFKLEEQAENIDFLLENGVDVSIGDSSD
jgi:hypothetical protein